ncbi:Asp-tRNAAsn/Glu-tRNAGln amidotransferase A subunit or related amidase [Geosmithia morbida]|uniref:amidase n=1 Tax=Geosmithia morbida TaxID=1094350 RepID=A0A9P4YYG2_9HYPO|nr:Asp-tRNAAsn/Glu-tRNAGln amidotransferase A subunit or related amidase [Geosmithia morbida]KAF4125205.1 Asp-tRNAAsn/Glu-tRNAGln amidotransferase A subunit or related amidase [Geosmithia morbida]
MFLTDYLNHRRDCRLKQQERSDRLKPFTSYHGPFSVLDRETINMPIAELVQAVQKDPNRAAAILETYTKVAVKAHEKTNCVTEVMVPSAREWVADGSVNLRGPLAGIPISLKDTINVGGYDSTTGMSRFVGNAKPVDGSHVRLLKDAGAIPYVKTNIPITLLSFESTNDIWGRCTNPYNAAYSPGGSTGGEAALLAMGGRIGIGSDVAGSVRVPAHFSGVYSLRCSTGRWPKAGGTTPMQGQDGVPSVNSPMARTLDDLAYFTRSVVGMQPWKYDCTCHPLAWRADVEAEYADPARKLRVGVLRTDGVVDPSPACRRALDMAEVALRGAGHEIVDVSPPSPYEALRLASILLCHDGLRTVLSLLRPGEWNDPGTAQMVGYMRLPRPVRYLHYLWVKYVRGDAVWAGLLDSWSPKSAYEVWGLNARREAYRQEWSEWWDGVDVDFILTTPNATPAVPHGAMHDVVSSCGYTFLFNLVGLLSLLHPDICFFFCFFFCFFPSFPSFPILLIDYTAGILPVTHVDKNKDQLPDGFDLTKLNGVAQGAYKLYDADAMHGLPVGVQVVGRRLEEEKVLALMKRVEDALGNDKFQLLEVD